MYACALEFQFYVEAQRAQARLHKVVETLIVGTCRGNGFGVEWSLVVNEEEVIRS